MTQQLAQPLEMKLRWIFGYPDPPKFDSGKRSDFRNLATHRIVGDRFQGKSALGELILARYILNGSTGYDFFAANDNESLAVLDQETCPFAKRVVLVHGPSVKLRCNYQTMKISDLDPRRTESGRLFITCKSFYKDEEEHYAGLARFTKVIQARDAWDRIDVLLIREAQEYIASRMRTNMARNQKEASEDFIAFHNQAFHSGISCIIDSQREVEVAKNLRELGTFTYYKNLGAMEIPRRIWWLMSSNTANLDLDVLRKLNPDQFVITTNKNCVGLGRFTLVPWHINRGAGLMQKFDIHVTDSETGQSLDVSDSPAIEVQKKSGAGRPTKFTPEQEEMMLRFIREGKKATEIFVELVKVGFTGKLRAVQVRKQELALREQAAT